MRLRTLAKKQGVGLRISGATGAALPTIDLVQFNLAGSQINQIEAILTGTINYVLSEMMNNRSSLDKAIEKAQVLVVIKLYRPDHAFAHVNGRSKAIRIDTSDMGTLTVAGGDSNPQATVAAALKDTEHLLQERRLRTRS